MRTIGDLVYKVDKKTGTKKVIKCTVQDLFLIHQAKEEDEFSFIPIPINDISPKKLGFKTVTCYGNMLYLPNNSSGKPIFDENMGFFLFNDGIMELKDSSRYEGTIRVINFLHEFQGVYFALTGEDIKIEL